ncbi:hypothetical protein BT67DRAFT_456193 [Trichocladium antarcticum]|uniref:Atos-like conserved domain-containing protein n=1 Tax=Trichocladium antarcticum TaxID=1450529 RepID=A0AAN6UJN1_9PEZI|nr:hypothetical protein BT67DRAFT_456193 [Trichocladium antarcticum]
MPIFHDHVPGLGKPASDYVDSAPIPIQSPPGMGRWLSRRLSEESIRTELCEGPVPDSPRTLATPERSVPHAVSDRAELIARLKRGESPTWIPNRHLESLFHQNKPCSPPRTPPPPGPASPALLPAVAITPEKQDGLQGQHDIGPPLQEGLSIERPRSAFHSGNFTPLELSPVGGRAKDTVRPANDIWMGTSPPRDLTPFEFSHAAPDYRREAFRSPGPSSLGSSFSSSFAYQPPTSPLVQSESNDDMDLTLPLNSFKIDANSPRTSRRHTLHFTQPPFANTTAHRTIPPRREGTCPYQAHQPRRSLTATPNPPFTESSPQTPGLPRSRRPSFSLEASALHASMVGSYEESILRGRMSTTPSKPLEFMAQIGVLGLGKCKSSLRCPSHVTLPFSAVFYSYARTSYGRSNMDEGPSPYVGQVDLENGLPNLDDGQRAKRKLQSRYHDRKGLAEELTTQDCPAELSEDDGAARLPKPKRRSRSPKAPPGGRYRIPEKGQLQIIIKNQNKTAVKLYLVPYDLAGMEPGTKTFIRQRSYSAGPMAEPGTAGTQDARSGTAEAADRPTLRYLIHLHICSPAKGRHYLYKSIRVVFANRVPDGKERLRNEVTYPDPRFTPYKPMRGMHPPAGAGANHAPAPSTSAGIPPAVATSAAEQTFRRRSSIGVAFSHAPHHQHNHHHRPFHFPEAQHCNSPTATGVIPGTHATEQAPPRTTTAAAAAMDFIPPAAADDDIEMSDSSATTTTQTGTTTTAFDPGTYDKLSKGDVGYYGTRSPAAEGLLSKRLRSLGVPRP